MEQQKSFREEDPPGESFTPPENKGNSVGEILKECLKEKTTPTERDLISEIARLESTVTWMHDLIWQLIIQKQTGDAN